MVFTVIYDNGNESTPFPSYFQVIFKLFSVIFKLFSVVFKLFSSCFKLFSCYFQVVFKLFSSAFLRLPRCETMTAGVATQRRGPGNYRLFGNGQHIIHRGDAHTEYQSALVAVGLDRGMTAAEIADVPQECPEIADVIRITKY